MLYSEFLETEYQKLMEIINEFELKKLNKNKNVAQKKKLDKIGKSRLNISAKRLSLIRGKSERKNKQKTDEEIKRLAAKSARRILSKKILNKDYDDLTDFERQEFSKRKKERIELYNQIKKNEYEKLKRKYSGKKTVDTKKDDVTTKE